MSCFCQLNDCLYYLLFVFVLDFDMLLVNILYIMEREAEDEKKSILYINFYCVELCYNKM